ncbi:hypothetical protein PR048_033522 [Dryococelus australis]|uniref:Uncharacterized protein n=1 Tax=Dryococelus australis TaxID=614101 RepID=A0ABQ9G1F5_9NEOP|nr:hypothetical protein PR048_033522 [Dryococelus australis]
MARERTLTRTHTHTQLHHRFPRRQRLCQKVAPALSLTSTRDSADHVSLPGFQTPEKERVWQRREKKKYIYMYAPYGHVAEAPPARGVNNGRSAFPGVTSIVTVFGDVDVAFPTSDSRVYLNPFRSYVKKKLTIPAQQRNANVAIASSSHDETKTNHTQGKPSPNYKSGKYSAKRRTASKGITAYGFSNSEIQPVDQNNLENSDFVTMFEETEGEAVEIKLSGPSISQTLEYESGVNPSSEATESEIWVVKRAWDCVILFWVVARCVCPQLFSPVAAMIYSVEQRVFLVRTYWKTDSLRGLCTCASKKRGSDTGDTNTLAWRLIAPTRKACSVSVVTLHCAGSNNDFTENVLVHRTLEVLVYLESISAFGAERRKGDKGDTASRIKCAITAKRRTLNWRAEVLVTLRVPVELPEEKFGGRQTPSKSSIWALAKNLQTKRTLLVANEGVRPNMRENTVEVVRLLNSLNKNSKIDVISDIASSWNRPLSPSAVEILPSFQWLRGKRVMWLSCYVWFRGPRWPSGQLARLPPPPPPPPIVPDDAVGRRVSPGISRPPPSFRSCSILNSIALIGSEDSACTTPQLGWIYNATMRSSRQSDTTLQLDHFRYQSYVFFFSTAKRVRPVRRPMKVKVESNLVGLSGLLFCPGDLAPNRLMKTFRRCRGCFVELSGYCKSSFNGPFDPPLNSALGSIPGEIVPGLPYVGIMPDNAAGGLLRSCHCSLVPCMAPMCIVQVPNTPGHACNQCADVIFRAKVPTHLDSSCEIWKCCWKLWTITNYRIVSRFTNTSAFSEALLKFYLQGIPPPRLSCGETYLKLQEHSQKRRQQTDLVIQFVHVILYRLSKGPHMLRIILHIGDVAPVLDTSLATGEVYSMALRKALEVEGTAMSTKHVSRGGMVTYMSEVASLVSARSLPGPAHWTTLVSCSVSGPTLMFHDCSIQWLELCLTLSPNDNPTPPSGSSSLVNMVRERKFVSCGDRWGENCNHYPCCLRTLASTAARECEFTLGGFVLAEISITTVYYSHTERQRSGQRISGLWFTNHADKIGVKHVYTEVDFANGSHFIRHALDDSEPIADLSSNSRNLPIPIDRQLLYFNLKQSFQKWSFCLEWPTAELTEKLARAATVFFPKSTGLTRADVVFAGARSSMQPMQCDRKPYMTPPPPSIPVSLPSPPAANTAHSFYENINPAEVLAPGRPSASCKLSLTLRGRLDVSRIYPYRCRDTVLYWYPLSLNAILLVKTTPVFPYWPAANQWSARVSVGYVRRRRIKRSASSLAYGAEREHTRCVHRCGANEAIPWLPERKIKNRTLLTIVHSRLLPTILKPC